jgi:curved DNA-binding protein CbpA
VADKTLYDILEVSSGASPEIIKTAYERLSAKYDPDSAANQANPQAKVFADAVREAFLTVNNPKLRVEYDAKLAARARPAFHNVEVIEPFWTLPKVIVLSLALVIGGGIYYKHKQSQDRIAAEQAIAETQAREAAEKAKAETEQARIEFLRQREESIAEDRQRRQGEAAIRSLSAQSDAAARQNQYEAQRAQQAERAQQSARQREEQQATNAARAQAQRERAELCRIERQRYGQSASC